MYKPKSLQRLTKFRNTVSVRTPDHKRFKVCENANEDLKGIQT